MYIMVIEAVKRILQKSGLLISEASSNKVFNRSYSQCGEDLLVQYIFNLRGIQKPSYIDIGANHPYFLSNTALFYEKGSRGINIEANPQLAENFKTHRPEDINLNIGIDSIDMVSCYS